MISRSRSSTSSQHETNVRNLNLQDSDGSIVVTDSAGVNVTTTDHGAVEGVLSLLGDVAAAVQRMGEDALRGSADVSEDVLQFGGRALDAQGDVVARSLATVDLATTRGIDAVRDVSELAIDKQYETTDRALDFGEVALADVRGLVSENIRGLTALARDTSQTADDRIVKVVGIAIGGVVLLMVGAWLLQRYGGSS